MKWRCYVDKVFGEWVVIFNVGVQSVQVARPQETKEEVKWFAGQFRKMIRKVTIEPEE